MDDTWYLLGIMNFCGMKLFKEINHRIRMYRRCSTLVFCEAVVESAHLRRNVALLWTKHLSLPFTKGI